jgi:hypothetical protein
MGVQSSLTCPKAVRSGSESDFSCICPTLHSFFYASSIPVIYVVMWMATLQIHRCSVQRHGHTFTYRSALDAHVTMRYVTFNSVYERITIYINTYSDNGVMYMDFERGTSGPKSRRGGETDASNPADPGDMVLNIC